MSATMVEQFPKIPSPTNDDNNSNDSFVAVDNFQEDEEKGKTHMLSYQDVQILQNNLRQIFSKSGKDNINFTNFCQIIQNMVPSPQTNDDIKSIFNELDLDKNGTISYHSFLETYIFHKFLKSIGFIILNRTRTITNEEMDDMDNQHDRFFFRALSIHNAHDREIILSEAETIQKLQHWIDTYGKPAQLKCQNLQFEIDESLLIIETLKCENKELKNEIQQSMLDSRQLKERGDSLQEQMSMVHDEYEQQKQYLSLEETKYHQVVNTLQRKNRKSITQKNDTKNELNRLMKENEKSMQHTKKQLKDQGLFIKSLKIDKANLIAKMEDLNKLIQQQQIDINLLESENTGQAQEIEFLQSRSYQDNEINKMNEMNDIDGIILNITTTEVIETPTILEEILSSTPDGDGDGDGDYGYGDIDGYELFNQKSLDSANSNGNYNNFYRMQINELKQQLLDEQRKRQELEDEFQLKMDQELKNSMIRRNSRSNHCNTDSIPLDVVKENVDDLHSNSVDELQPFINDNQQPNKTDKTTVFGCQFLFGMC